MKKFIFLASIFAMSLTTLTSCSSDDDSNVENVEKEDFTNANYIKKIMIGKWQYKAFFSDYWVTTITDSYFIFNADNTYTYKPNSDSYPIEKGTYEIIPATTEYNAVLKITSSDNYTTNLILVNLDENNTVELIKSNRREKYQKQ